MEDNLAKEEKVAANVKTFAESQDQKGFDMDPLEGKNLKTHI